jgi:alpha-tubulin suppressor-like RCC1 family protein
VLSEGTLRCWGDNDAGQLGIGNNANVGDDELPASVDPVSVSSSPGVRVDQLSFGLFNACAVLSDGSVKCWGSNFDGELGTGSTIGENGPLSSAPAARVTNASGVTVTQVGSSTHSCALLSDGSVKCWGAASMGQLGTGNREAIGDNELPSSIGPISLTTASGVIATQISVGFYHSCALLSDGSVKCWGDNEFGQLGTGNTDNIGDDELPSSIGPVRVTTNRRLTVTALQAASYHTCVLLSDHSVKCWGRNDYGQLGIGSTDNIGDDELPSSVGAVSVTTARGLTVDALAMGGHHSCAVLSDGSAKCWGNNQWGQLGIGNTDNIGDDEVPSSIGPIDITRSPGVTVQKLGLGRVHTCAFLSDSSVKCWGENSYGQLGLGSTETMGDDELPSSIGPVVLF